MSKTVVSNGNAAAIDQGVEQRIQTLEAAVAELRQQLPAATALGWLQDVIGSMKDQPAFEEVIALGRAYREADLPSDEDDL